MVEMVNGGGDDDEDDGDEMKVLLTVRRVKLRKETDIPG